MDSLKGASSNWQRLLITIALMGLVVWGLVLTTLNLHAGVSKDSGGLVDVYQRSTDVLHTLLPLLSIALGYWFGAAGKEHAEQKADTATRQLTAFLGTTASQGDLLERARQADPKAFPPNSGASNAVETQKK